GEGGIRDWSVTGVQTCALPISPTGASLTVTGGTPTVSTPILVSPTGASLTVTGGTPGVATPVLVSPVAASLTVTGGTPAVATPRSEERRVGEESGAAGARGHER